MGILQAAKSGAIYGAVVGTTMFNKKTGQNMFTLIRLPFFMEKCINKSWAKVL